MARSDLSNVSSDLSSSENLLDSTDDASFPDTDEVRVECNSCSHIHEVFVLSFLDLINLSCTVNHRSRVLYLLFELWSTSFRAPFTVIFHSLLQLCAVKKHFSSTYR